MSDDADLTSVPEGWVLRSLGDLCTMSSGGTPPKSDRSLWTGSVPWVSGKDLKSLRLDDVVDHITPEAAEDYSKVAPAGSVLVLMRGMGLANGFALSLIERPMAFNQDLKALVPRDGLEGPFLMYALTFAGTRMLRNVADAAHGTKRLTQDDLDTFRIPVPPAGEQRAVAAVLDRCSRAIEIAARAERAADSLRVEARKHLFFRGVRGERSHQTDIGAQPESWTVLDLGAAAKVGNGTTPNRRHPPYWQNGSIPWITSGRMYERRIAGSDVHVTPLALRENSLPLLPPGTVLIAIVGQGKTLGHCAILDVEATVSRHVGFIQLTDERLMPEFVVAFLERQYQQLRQLASGNGSTRGALTCALLRRVRVPVPSIQEQREIVTILAALDSVTESHRRKRAVLEELFKAMLHKLMTGEVRVDQLDLSALGGTEAEAAR